MIKGSVATAALALSQFPLRSFGLPEPEENEILIPFTDKLPATPNRPMIQWEQLTEWMTPEKDFFAVSHYGPAKVDAEKWNLEVSGLVKHPKTFSLAGIKARKRREITATLECSGNGSSPTFMGAVGNTKWAGTPLGPLLKECGFQKGAIEVAFFGTDEKKEKIKDNEYLQNFGRSLTIADALDDRILLAYEMNGKPLPPEHGFPLRLIVPGWYGVAWVKWLKRIEVLDHRFMGRFMARDYVTIRGEERPDCTIWRETSVTKMNVKSVVARVVRRSDGSLRISGAAWTDGTPLERVELKIDDGSWIETHTDKRNQSKYAWTFWHYDWQHPLSGEHTLVSRATDANGVIQPSADDPRIKLKKTYYEANQQYPRKFSI
ncbi:sulfite oxidase [Pedosphaera parvula]|uniref:Oxidoreductase molybdopterin binding n=1 Tax=Pedosphaera parvula (strain Ellin514) TaxID=320771 RepID=B9XHA3_PEDPL|nr:sulfite oxidase [Pedosphaera parvula]EEF60738.1 oxidoreductase molybdopterin binding [Pedosphaera parvula Ellin514]